MKELIIIGKGRFSKAYYNGNSVIVISCDPVKECMSLFGTDSLFPTIERLDVLDNGMGVYRMPKYQRITAPKRQLSGTDYSFYRKLVDISNKPRPFNPYDLYSHWYKLFESELKEYQDYQQQLIGQLDDISNYGTKVCFEVSPRNISACDGKIVLRDIFYIAGALSYSAHVKNHGQHKRHQLIEYFTA